MYYTRRAYNYGLKLKQLTNLLHQNNIKTHITKEALNTICEEGFDPQFGARPIKRVIQKKVMNELSKQLLAGNISKDAIIVLDSIDGKMVFRKPINEKEEAESLG